MRMAGDMVDGCIPSKLVQEDMLQQMLMEVVICLDSPLKFFLQLCKCNHFFRLYLETNIDGNDDLS